MLINAKIQNKFAEVHRELEEQINLVTKEATKALYNYRCKYRVCLNSGDLDNESLLASEFLWDKKYQKMKTLEQIHKILEANQSDSGLYDIQVIDRELMSYTILSTQKELFDIAKIFSSYRDKLFN